LQGKEKFSAILVVSSCGEKVKPGIVSSSKSPRCFGGKIFHKSFLYYSQTNSWVDKKIFQNYLKILDNKFKMESRKIALILDNCSVHSLDEMILSNVELFFLSPKTTPIGQPLD
jgi:hypothetical protein